MANQMTLEELADLIQKAVRPGPITRIFGLGSRGIDEINEILKRLTNSDGTADAADSLIGSLPSNLSLNSIISWILDILGGVIQSPFAQLARLNFGRNVLVTTTAGTVEGVVAEVGSWYVVLNEAQGSTVIVNLLNTTAFQPNEPGVDEV